MMRDERAVVIALLEWREWKSRERGNDVDDDHDIQRCGWLA